MAHSALGAGQATAACRLFCMCVEAQQPGRQRDPIPLRCYSCLQAPQHWPAVDRHSGSAARQRRKAAAVRRRPSLGRHRLCAAGWHTRCSCSCHRCSSGCCCPRSGSFGCRATPAGPCCVCGGGQSEEGGVDGSAHGGMQRQPCGAHWSCTRASSRCRYCWSGSTSHRAAAADAATLGSRSG